MEVTTRPLGDICDETGGTIRTGPFGSQLHQSDYQDDGVPVVMPKNIIDGSISTQDIARVGEEHIERLSQHKLQPGYIVYGRRGDIGRHALITEREAGWLCGTGSLRISVGTTVLDPTFLHYYLYHPEIIGWIFNLIILGTFKPILTRCEFGIRRTCRNGSGRAGVLADRGRVLVDATVFCAVRSENTVRIERAE